MTAFPLDMCDSTVTTYRPVTTQDAGGSPVLTFHAYLQGIPASVQPKSGTDNPIYGGRRIKWDYAVYVDPANDILVTDHILWIDALGVPHNMRIPGQADQIANGIVMRLDCQEIPQDAYILGGS